jgi:hypothetical protein
LWKLIKIRAAIWTGLARNLDEEGTAILAKTGTYWKSIDEGAAPIMVAALDPALDGESSISYQSSTQTVLSKI